MSPAPVGHEPGAIWQQVCISCSRGVQARALCMFVQVPAVLGQPRLSHKTATCTPVSTTSKLGLELATLVFTAIINVTSQYLLSQQQEKSWRARG